MGQCEYLETAYVSWAGSLGWRLGLGLGLGSRVKLEWGSGWGFSDWHCLKEKSHVGIQYSKQGSLAAAPCLWITWRDQLRLSARSGVVVVVLFVWNH